MILVSPFVHEPVAPMIGTAEGPVIEKSDPLGAIDPQEIGSVNVKVSEVGEHWPIVTAPIAIGPRGAIVNVVELPASTCLLHAPTMVLPSLPVDIVTVYVPGTEMGAVN
jgi:hypothetical protein